MNGFVKGFFVTPLATSPGIVPPFAPTGFAGARGDVMGPRFDQHFRVVILDPTIDLKFNFFLILTFSLPD